MSEQANKLADVADGAGVAARVHAILGPAEGDLTGYLLKGGKVSASDVRTAIEDAQQATVMLGCAMIGAQEYFGGQPADKVICEWTFIAERKLEIAKALAIAAQEGADA